VCAPHARDDGALIMDSALQRRIQRYGWDRAAAHYEECWSRQLRGAQERLLAVAALGAGEQVLDVACGTGLVTFAAAAAVGATGMVVGTDLSEQMVELAAQRAPPNVRIVRMDAEKLDFPDATFDVALSSLGLMYVPDTDRAIAEMRRVIKPGGRVAVVVWGARRQCGWAEIFPIVDARVKSEVCPLFFRLGAGDALTRELEAAGFTNVRSERLTIPLRYDTPDEACAAAFVGGPVALAYSRFADDVREQVHAEYLQSIAPYRDGAGYSVPGEFVVAVTSVPA
jgi:ubiquinone/menaquinone biosynthesis C-methylase UbiE